MLNFPVIREKNDPPAERMSLTDYVQFCLFCMENNPQLADDSGQQRKSGERNITRPFRLQP